LVVVNVAGADHGDVVDAAAGGVAEAHLRRLGQALLEAAHVLGGVPRQGDFHQHLLAPEQRRPVDLRTVALDQPGAFQLAHPLPGRRHREVDRIGQGRLGDPPILGKDAQDLQVIAVELVHALSSRPTTSATTARVSPLFTSPGKCRAASRPLRLARYSRAGSPVRRTLCTRAITSPFSTVSPRSRHISSRPSSSLATKQSPSGMSSITDSPASISPCSRPKWISRLRTPRSAMARLFAVLLPPPPSSVVTNTLPCCSAAVSYMPTASSSSMRMQ